MNVVELVCRGWPLFDGLHLHLCGMNAIFVNQMSKALDVRTEVKAFVLV